MSMKLLKKLDYNCDAPSYITYFMRSLVMSPPLVFTTEERDRFYWDTDATAIIFKNEAVQKEDGSFDITCHIFDRHFEATQGTYIADKKPGEYLYPWTCRLNDECLYKDGEALLLILLEYAQHRNFLLYNILQETLVNIFKENGDVDWLPSTEDVTEKYLMINSVTFSIDPEADLDQRISKRLDQIGEVLFKKALDTLGDDLEQSSLETKYEAEKIILTLLGGCYVVVDLSKQAASRADLVKNY